MATQSVATLQPASPAPNGTECDLFLAGGDVLTVCMNRGSKKFPPRLQALKPLNDMIQGLARANTAVAEKVMTAPDEDVLWFDAAANVGFAITLLSQLADGVVAELKRED